MPFVNFKGKKITAGSYKKIAQKAKIDESQARRIKKNPYIYIIDGKDFGRYDIREKPLLLKKFGLQGVRTKKLLTDNITVKNKTILQEKIGTGQELNMHIQILISFSFSSTKDAKRTLNRYVSIEADEETINDYAIDEGEKYIKTIGPIDAIEWGIDDIIIRSFYTGQIFNIKDMELRDNDVLDIFNEYVNVDLNKNDNSNCVKTFLKNKLKKISEKTIDDLKTTIKDIIEFCEKYRIELYIYHYNGTLLDKHVPKKRNKNYPVLVFMAYNNHLYPINNKYLEKRKHDNLKIEIVEDATDKLKEFIYKNILPSSIKINDEKIISFIVDNTKYLQNEDYYKCKSILEKFGFGLDEYLYDTITLPSIFNILESTYIKENINSFFPNASNYTKGGYNYKTDEEIDYKDLETIDKSKAYSYALKELEFLISCDFRQNKIIKYDEQPSEICEHYLYIAKPSESSILLPNRNIYSGEHLIFCMNEGVEFKILESIECTRHINFYKKMITDMYEKIDNNSFKEIMNISIGKMERSPEIYDKTFFQGIYNKDQSDREEGYKIELTDKYNLVYNTQKAIKNIYNKKPISIQIKDNARRVLYKKMKDINLSTSDIIQIKTDSITYKKYKKNYGKILDGLDGWKEEEFKEIKPSEPYDNPDMSFNIMTTNKNVLANCYAGTGKTYTILNELIPKLDTEKKSYIILSPTHRALKEYRDANKHCKVIDHYTCSKTIPSEDVIIVDEYGMCNEASHNLIFKCFLLGKEIHLYGDIYQLPPVGISLGKISDQYTDLLFSNKKILDKNYRNDFTREYYDGLINSNDKNYLYKEVIKYRTKNITDADIIICYRNDIVDKYNAKMMELKGYKDFDVGMPVLSKTNALYKKEIYNNFRYIITSKNGDNYELDNYYKVTKKDLDNYFKPGYAMTLYGAQGDSFKSFYYPSDDKYFINPNTAYTLISRLKTK